MLNHGVIADKLSAIKSNCIKWERRGKGVRERYDDMRDLYLGYFERALASEPQGSERHKELLLERAAMFPRKGRLRECPCGRIYQGPLKARHHPNRMTHFCPGCRTIARQTKQAKHEKAIFNVWRDWRRLRRIREALGDPPLPKPTHCQHGQCDNERRLRQTWIRLDRPPRWLCPRHHWHAKQKAKENPFEPRPVGRPAKT